MPQDRPESPGLRHRREELRAVQTRFGERTMRAPGVPISRADAADLKRASNAVERQQAEQRRRLARDVGSQLQQRNK